MKDIQVKPYERLMARAIDSFVYLFILIAVIYFDYNYFSDSYYFAFILIWFTVESISVHKFRTTLGKRIFNIYIKKENGDNLELLESLKRSWFVLWYGMWLAVPVISLIGIYDNYIYLSDNKNTSYDKKLKLKVYKKISEEHQKNRRVEIIWGTFFISFIFVLFLNNLYGPLLYSKITGQMDSYNIGRECYENLDKCEEEYFKEDLEEIERLLNIDDSYFVNQIIKEYQWSYSGNCPCPYDRDSRGGRCGGRSSYSKGGQVSYCYESDIPNDLISFKQEDMLYDATSYLSNRVKKYIDVYKKKNTLWAILIIYIFLLLYLRRRLKVN